MSDDVSVPPEIVELIIDHLVGDAQALKACSVVGRSFVRPSHKNLFRRIDIDFNRRSPYEINERLSKVSVVSQHNLSSVRSVHVGPLPTQPSYDREPLLRVLQSFVNLSKVSISIQHDGQPLVSRDEIGVTNVDILRELCRPTITELRLSSSYYFPTDDFYRCTSLTHLALDDCAFLPPGQVLPLSARIPLKSLRIGQLGRPSSPDRGMPATQFLRQPFSPWDLRSLEEFSYLAPDDSQYEELMNLMRHLPKSLTSLSVEIPYSSGGNATQPRHAIDISMWPNLTRLGLHVYEDQHGCSGYLRRVIAQLARIPAANALSELLVGFTLYRRAAFDSTEWNKLDDFLVEERFGSVRVVRIEVRTWRDDRSEGEIREEAGKVLEKTGKCKSLYVSKGVPG
ncbi:hypothetical protein AX16_004794 [Volvariella volvacea WC 439]|nr:hypothetical protein AX16_004794 [Volvariella volvacea WC 439]